MAPKHGSFAPRFKHRNIRSQPLREGAEAFWAHTRVQGRSFLLIGRIDYASLPFMALLRGLFWLVLFVVLAFSFVVLFEYGPHNFASGFQKEFARVKTFVVKQAEKIQKPRKHR
jgi:CBS domain containing-hemolysin-like protein